MFMGEAAAPQYDAPGCCGGHAIDEAAASTRPPHAPSATRLDGGPPLGKAAAACQELSRRPHAFPAAAEFFATDTWMGLSTPGGQ